VIFDVLRATFIMSLIVPALILPIARPVIGFLSKHESAKHDGFLFLLPLASGFLVTGLFRLSVGVLQAHGHSVRYGLAGLASSVLNFAVFDPLFLVGLKTGLWGASLATVSSDLIVGVIVWIWLIRKQMIVFTGYRWFGKFSPEGRSALRVGLSALVTEVAEILPAAVYQKFLSAAAAAAGASRDVMGVYSLMNRIFNIVAMMKSTLVTAFLPEASFAYGARDAGRLIRLAFHFLWISVLWATVTGEAFAFFPVQLCRLWDAEPQFAGWIAKMVPRSVYTAPLISVPSVVAALLQAMKRGGLASVIPVVGQSVALPACSAALYFTGKTDPARLVWALAVQDAAGFIISVIVLPYRKLREMLREERQKVLHSTLDPTSQM
jgi:Na+-driven multidrug efflux pump